VNESREAAKITEDAELLDAARRAAALAAQVQRDARGRVDPSKWGEKGRSDFVTEVDLESERIIVSTLLDRFPTHEVLAEEGTQGRRAVDRPPLRWIVDPLDGTTNWLHGYPEYGISIAAADSEGLRIALVLNSATGERFEAVREAGAWRDGDPISVSRIEDLRLALVGTGFPFKRLQVLPDYVETFSRVLRATSGVRRAGAAALDLCDLACGRLDAFWEYWLMPWDVAAGALIVREAGGVFEQLPPPGANGAERAENGPAGLSAGGFLAANPLIAGRFRELVKGTLPGPSG